MKDNKRPLNNEIRAKRVQVITSEGENLGVISFIEARSKAQSLGLDLMQIGMNKDVAIVKMLDYGKYLYQKKKQDQKNKQKSKSPEMKTLRISYKISDHDMEVRKRQAEKFAEAGSVLKVNLMLRGRENHYGAIAEKKMEQFLEMLSEIYKVDKGIQRNGNNFNAILKPIK
ncbi:MAG: translation initiation factor IF-3 [Candidatus Gracilibacteria bacterium]|nr:translation initiation factor IF-3 [Candidatus Gracilibacteria bacterium]